MVNRKLQDTGYRIEPFVLECVAAMATLAVEDPTKRTREEVARH